MKYKTIPVVGTNCYLFWDELTMNAVCIDPGFAGRKIAREIQLMGLKLYCIFLTHAHADHVSGIDDEDYGLFCSTCPVSGKHRSGRQECTNLSFLIMNSSINSDANSL